MQEFCEVGACELFSLLNTKVSFCHRKRICWFLSLIVWHKLIWTIQMTLYWKMDLLPRIAGLAECWPPRAFTVCALPTHARSCWNKPNLPSLPTVFSLYWPSVRVFSTAIVESRGRVTLRQSQRLTASKRNTKLALAQSALQIDEPDVIDWSCEFLFLFADALFATFYHG